jgi:thiamine-phosphate pyrophosphorylase
LASKLYLISPPAIELAKFIPQLKSAVSGGEIAAFQLRLKDIGGDEILKAAETLLPICRANNIVFIINDSPEIAKKCGADGVHLGADDVEIKQARQMLGNDHVLGASCYNSIDLAISAAQNGADYVSFGAFYPTTTKIPKARAEIETLEKWTLATTIPCCAIGGVTPQNAEPLIKAGADFICAISYVWNHPISPQKAVAEFNRVFKSSPS